LQETGEAPFVPAESKQYRLKAANYYIPSRIHYVQYIRRDSEDGKQWMFFDDTTNRVVFKDPPLQDDISDEVVAWAIYERPVAEGRKSQQIQSGEESRIREGELMDVTADDEDQKADTDVASATPNQAAAAGTALPASPMQPSTVLPSTEDQAPPAPTVDTQHKTLRPHKGGLLHDTPLPDLQNPSLASEFGGPEVLEELRHELSAFQPETAHTTAGRSLTSLTGDTSVAEKRKDRPSTSDSTTKPPDKKSRSDYGALLKPTDPLSALQRKTSGAFNKGADFFGLRVPSRSREASGEPSDTSEAGISGHPPSHEITETTDKTTSLADALRRREQEVWDLTKKLEEQRAQQQAQLQNERADYRRRMAELEVKMISRELGQIAEEDRRAEEEERLRREAEEQSRRARQARREELERRLKEAEQRRKSASDGGDDSVD